MPTNRSKFFSLTLAALLVLGIAGCAPVYYVPDQGALQRMTRAEAYKTLESFNSVYFSRGSKGIGFGIRSIKAADGDIVIARRDDGNAQIIALKNLQIRSVTYYDYSIIILDKDWWLWGGYGAEEKEVAQVKKIADALFVLKQAASDKANTQEQPVPASEAETPRDKTAEPVLSARTLKLKKMANAAMRNHQFEDAIDLYREALDITPWWAEGRYNHAVMLAETYNYEEAVSEMKRYLLLGTNTRDVGTAQNKLYFWEHRIPNGNK